MRWIAAVGLLGLALPARAPAQQPAGAGAINPLQPSVSAQPASPAAPPKPTLADFAWLAGRWQGSWGPRIAQQTWTAPKAGVMLGTFQLAEGDKTLVLEVFTLVEDQNGIKFNLRHFTPALVAWEKPGPTVLSLASLDAKAAVFENPVDGQPKHAMLTRVDADTYVARSEIVPERGDMQVTEITYHRQSDGIPSKHGKEKKTSRP
ncbi:MAG TPA: DUF6265 family protein [Verrucomicrobiae bacterium]|nr:DUF6265 family protein [Verrucomicrobiae bacterium]